MTDNRQEEIALIVFGIILTLREYVVTVLQQVNGQLY